MRYLHYPVVIETDSNLVITKAFSPDLDLNIMLNGAKEEGEFQRHLLSRDFKEICQTAILEEISQLQKNRQIINLPSDCTEHYNKLEGLNNCNVALISVEVNLEKCFFEKTAPFLGYGSRIITAAAFSVLTLLALTLLENEASSPVVAYGGALLGFIMTSIIYTYSNAPKHLSQSFRYIDDILFRKPNPRKKVRPNKWKQYSSILTALAIIVAIGDVLCTAFVRYQSTVSLGEEANKKQILPSWLSLTGVYVSAVILGIAHATTDIIFESSFSYTASQDGISFFNKKVCPQSGFSSTNNHHEETMALI